MKLSNNLNSNGMATATRASIDSTPPSGGISNVSEADNTPTLMNMASGPKERGSRADALIEMASNDSYRLTEEAPRKGKMKG